MNRTFVGLLGVTLSLSAVAPWCAAQTIAATLPPDNVPAADTLLSRKVTVTLDHVSRSHALDAVASRANVVLQYRAELVDADERTVTLRLVNVPLSAAVERVLDGTDFQLVVLPGPRLTVLRTDAAVRAGLGGIIVGRVTDARTGKPVRGASVSVKGTKITVSTRDDGSFRLPDVDAGIQAIVVRALGYQLASKVVQVKDGGMDSVFVALIAAPTALTEVVTTATGDRKRYEVGNAVGTIKADSIVPTTLIRNMSDLLQGRVPGVVVSNTDGAVGAPSKIRLRGVNSLALNNDPIIILDGIRLNAQTTAASMQTNVGSVQMLQQATTYMGNKAPPLAPSRLDDIDPNSIESIDVLRGPSASSLYGTDAANGVIVIKTKRGQPGSWHGTLSGDNGWSTIPGTMPEMWWGWGNYNSGLITNACNLAAGGFATVAGGGCSQDSVTQFNPQNNPAMKTNGTGTNRSLNATLSGGTPSLLQFVSATVNSNVGMGQMSDAESRLISRLWSAAPPSWMVRPNTEQRIDGTSRTTINIGNHADVSLGSEGIYRNVLNGGSGFAPIGNSAGFGSSASDTLSYLPSEDQRTKVTTTEKRGIASLGAGYRPLSWLSFTGTVGGDYGLQQDEADLRAQDCSTALIIAQNGQGCPSSHTNGRGETFATTVNGNARLTFSPRSWLTLLTSVGEQYSHTSFYKMLVGNSDPNACPLAFGTTLLTPPPVCLSSSTQAFNVAEARDEAATAGVYVEESVTLFGVFTTFGVRRDVASAFGGQVTKSPPHYPKLNFSYPLSEKSFFPKQPYVSSLRLRVAYGQSGNQASQTAVLNNYALSQNTFANASSSSSVVVTQAGNPDLRPEKGTEWEGGFDVSFLENERIHAEVTLYRKFTRDALTSLTLAPSYGMDDLSQYVNLGNVQNRGFELLLNARILDSRPLAWDISLIANKNSNKLVHKAPTLNANGPLNTQFVEGYPLFGYWGLPVVSYQDADGNGYLDQTEVQFGTQKFFGAPYPTSDITYNSTLSLWNGSIRVNAKLDQINGQTTQLMLSNYHPRAAVDNTAPLAQQAAYIEAVANNNAYIGTSSTVRLSEVSVTYNVPRRLVQQLLRAETLGLTLAGRNVGLWSSYAGKDPNVDTSGLFGEATQDNALGTPQPRMWTLRFNLGL